MRRLFLPDRYHRHRAAVLRAGRCDKCDRVFKELSRRHHCFDAGEVRFPGVHLVLVANARGQCCGPRVEEAQQLAAIDPLRRDGRGHNFHRRVSAGTLRISA